MTYSKYAAKPTYVDGRRFDSKAEAARFSQLTMLERAKVIKDLVCQPSFKLVVNGTPVCVYRADFSYVENGKPVTEDVKGFKTEVYKLKRKLLLALFPTMDHREVGIRQRRSKTDPRSAEIQQVFKEESRRRG